MKRAIVAAVVAATIGAGIFIVHRTGDVTSGEIGTATSIETDSIRAEERALNEPKVPAILKRIAWCESKDRHFDDEGNVVRGVLNPQDIGRYQINLGYHEKTAKEMRLDLFDEEDNETYAIWLYGKKGTDPWNWSRGCWGGGKEDG